MISLDSNILVYAFDSSDPDKQAVSLGVVAQAMRARELLTNQVVGEFLNVCRKRGHLGLAAGLRQIELWLPFFRIEATKTDHLLEAGTLAARNGKQFWDMVIVRVAAAAGAVALLSEDIGDGELIDGVRIVNPLDPANAVLVDNLLRPSS